MVEKHNFSFQNDKKYDFLSKFSLHCSNMFQNCKYDSQSKIGE